mgnify:CR=1 FL=1
MKTTNTTNIENIPDSIQNYDQWVCWTYHSDHVKGRDRRRKVPINPRTGRFAKVTNPDTWTSMDEAVESVSNLNEHISGVGFVFTDDDPFVGVDLDDCRSLFTGQLHPWALEVVGRLATYTEVSPSGTGVKAIMTTDAVMPSRRRSNPGLEVYRSSRFFTITGDIVGINLETSDATDALRWIHEKYFPVPGPSTADEFPESKPMVARDEQVVNKALSARNGAKFRDLWNGEIKANEGNQSEADLSLCRLLAFWCGPGHQQVDRLFRQSGLFRSKWDEKHYSSGATYGMETIRKAILAQGNVFYRWPVHARSQ